MSAMELGRHRGGILDAARGPAGGVGGGPSGAAGGRGAVRTDGWHEPVEEQPGSSPKLLSARWEEDCESFETALRAAAPVPAEAASVAISLDGVMTPMKDGERSEKRERAAEAGKQTRGPAGYQEVGCGTISLYDRDGNRLGTVRFARMPEAGKATLKGMLTEELAGCSPSGPT